MLLEDFKQLVTNINLLKEDEDIPIKTPEQIEKEVEEERKEANIKTPESEGESKKQNNSQEKGTRNSVREAIKPQVEVANSIITSIKDSFEDNCNQSKKIGNMEDQIKNWEKQLRGACEQIVAIVNNKNFTIDKSKCSPRAFKKISNSSSRDLSSLDLCAAIIVFYNSLG